MYMCIYNYTHTLTCIRTHVRTPKCARTHTHVNAHTHSHTHYLCVCMCIHATHCNTLQNAHCNTLLLACKCRDWKAEGLTTLVDLSTLVNERMCKNVSITPVIHCNALQQVFSGSPRWYVQHGSFILLQHLAHTGNTLATHWQHTGNTLQHTAIHCNTLQYTATHCNTLQHTATCAHMNDEPVMSQDAQLQFMGPDLAWQMHCVRVCAWMCECIKRCVRMRVRIC